MTQTPNDHPASFQWWDWPLTEPSPYLLKRMLDRRFSESDLREMLTLATVVEPDAEPGRWVAHTRSQGRDWDIVIEPQVDEQVLVVVTAYPLDE